jgi:histidyl-tRNA synthetase
VLDCKVPADQPIIETLPVIADSLDEASKAHFAAVTAALDAAGVPTRAITAWCAAWTTTRAPPSSSRTAGLGAQNALLGGGRYDGLSEMLGGPRAPGIGFAMGEDRLVLTLLLGTRPKLRPTAKADAFIAPLGEGLNAAALVLARELRHQGLWIELGEGSFRLKKSFEAADKTARTSSFWAKTSSIRYSDSEELLHRHTDQGSSRGAGRFLSQPCKRSKGHR